MEVARDGARWTTESHADQSNLHSLRAPGQGAGNRRRFPAGGLPPFIIDEEKRMLRELWRRRRSGRIKTLYLILLAGLCIAGYIWKPSFAASPQQASHVPLALSAAAPPSGALDTVTQGGNPSAAVNADAAGNAERPFQYFAPLRAGSNFKQGE